MITKDELENNLNRVHEWIRGADNKVSILLALEGIIITLLISDSISSVISDLRYGCWSTILLIAGLVFLFVSAYKAIMAIIPRLKRGKKPLSLLYFGDVACMDLQSYEEKMRKMSEKDYEDQLLEQIHISSVIASSKHKHFRDSIIALSLAFLLLTAVYLLRFLPLWLLKMN